MCMKQLNLNFMLALLLCMVCSKAMAYDAFIDGIYYNFSEEGAEVTYRAYGSSNKGAYNGEVIIPEFVNYNGKDYKVTSIGRFAFYYNTGLTSVTMPNTITIIGEHAFRSCDKLNPINIPLGVVSIGNYAFEDCESLTSIIIPSSVTTIGGGAFSSCGKLSSFTIPSSVTRIGGNPFIYTAWYESLPDGVIYKDDVLLGWKNKRLTGDFEIQAGTRVIADNSLAGCAGLTSVTIPSNVIVGARVFNGCVGLTTVTLPDDLTRIEESLFESCSSLTSIDIPSGVTTIGKAAFKGCAALSSIDIPDRIEDIESNAFEGCTAMDSFDIPITINKIADGMFKGCTGLTAIHIPDNITEIGAYAYSGCTSLVAVTIPDNVTAIGKYAFYGCRGLKSFVIGKGITYLPDGLVGDTNLLSLTIGVNVNSGAQKWAENATKPVKIIWLNNTLNHHDGTVNIHSGNDSWYRYPLLTSMFEVDGVKYVPTSMADRTCDVIDAEYDGTVSTPKIGPTVTYRGVTFTVSAINAYAFYKNDQLKDVEIRIDSLIGKNAFAECANLESAVVDNKDLIGESAFSQCSSLKNVEFGSRVERIGSWSFYKCYALQEVTIPDNITTVAVWAFNDCTALSSLTIGKGLSAVNGFGGCTNLEKLVIPPTVSLIEKYAFSGSGIKTLIIEDSEDDISINSDFGSQLDSVYAGRKIANLSFKGYKTLRAIKMVKATEIPNNAFWGCTNLSETDFGINISSIGVSAFEGCTSLKKVYFGDEVTIIENKAFSGCNSLETFTFSSKLQTIKSQAFVNCTNITTLYSHAITPPICWPRALDDIDKWACTLTVPKGCVDAYKAADQWKEFFFFEEGEEPAVTEISHIHATKQKDRVVYGVDGRRRNEMMDGINVVRDSCGKTKKILAK